MEVKATRQIIDYDADTRAVIVINKGETGELSDVMLEKHKGSWEPAGAKDKPAPAANKPKAPAKPKTSSSELGALRKQYREVFGKGPSPKWGVDVLKAKIAEKTAAIGDDDGNGTPSTGDGTEPAPAGAEGDAPAS